MRIEPLTAEAAEYYKKELADFYHKNVCSAAYYAHYTIEEAYDKISKLIDHLRSHTALVYGAFDGKEIVGFIWAYVHQFREENRMYVSEIRVREDYRCRGIGTKLLESVEAKTKEMKIGATYLHAEAGNTTARRLYEALGYREERIQLRKEIKAYESHKKESTGL